MSLRSRKAVYDTLPGLLPDTFGAGQESPGMPKLSERVVEQVTGMLGTPSFDAWTEALSRVGNCAHPIRLRGRSETVDTTTGEIISTYSSRG